MVAEREKNKVVKKDTFHPLLDVGKLWFEGLKVVLLDLFSVNILKRRKSLCIQDFPRKHPWPNRK